jgi:hypothetical protein
MPVTVQGKLVPALVNLLDQLWISLDAFANEVECSTNRMPSQHLKQARGIPRVWAIVKGQRDPAACFCPHIQDFRVAALSSLIVPV